MPLLKRRRRNQITNYTIDNERINYVSVIRLKLILKQVKLTTYAAVHITVYY